MEHVIKEQTGDRQFRLTAESGWLLKSTKSGKTYREIDTLDLKRWEVIEDPDVENKACDEKPKKTKKAKK